MRILYSFILSAIALAMLAGCSAEQDQQPDNNGSTDKVSVRINLSASSAGSTVRSTRAAEQGIAPNIGWDDRNAADGEMMNNCFVIAVQDGIVKSVLVSEDYAQQKSQSSTLTALIDEGTTTFYSFANIRPAELGIDPDTSVGQALPDRFDQKTYSVSGNTPGINTFNAGIPMSNKETVQITKQTRQVDLHVIRMVAKVRLQLRNMTSTDINITSVSLTDITDNVGNNLYLLPDVSDNTVTPHIAATDSKTDYKLTLATPQTVKAGGTATTNIDFYVNESEAVVPRHFVINIGTTQTTISNRVAMTNWTSISRNDYLVIPIALNDFRLTYEVEQFTAIGVLPEVVNDKDRLTVRFKTYGEFHLRPTMTRISDGKVLTPGTDAADGWTLGGDATRPAWSILEMWPEGGEGVCIYDEMPYANHNLRTFEGVIGRRAGYALHQVLFSVKSNGTTYEIPYKIEIIKE